MERPRPRIKVHELRLASWNVLSLHRISAFASLKEQLAKYKIGVMALQEVRWKGNEFTPVNEWLCVLRIRGKMFNVSLICVHAPIEKADEEIKDKFYEQLENSAKTMFNFRYNLLLFVHIFSLPAVYLRLELLLSILFPP
jgi:hypothetical protein